MAHTNSPGWPHFVAISTILHVVMLLAGNALIPDLPQPRVLSSTTAPSVFARIDLNAYMEDQVVKEPPALREDANPFEEPSNTEVPHPQIVLPFHKSVPEQDADKSIGVKPRELPQTEPAIETTHGEDEPGKANLQDATDTDTVSDAGMNSEITAERAGLAEHPVTDKNTTGHSEVGKPIIGRGSSHVDETALWREYRSVLNNHFKKHRHYPEMARRMRMTGTVILAVEIARDGKIVSIRVEQSSGFEILDDAAVASAQKASPVPSFPEGTTEQTQTLLIPYRYSLER